MDMVAGMANITYAQGYDDAEDVIDEKLIAEAVEAAKKQRQQSSLQDFRMHLNPKALTERI